MPETTRPTYLTVPELAELLRISEPAVHAMRHRGRGPAAYKVGKKLLFRQSDVDAWLEEHAA